MIVSLMADGTAYVTNLKKLAALTPLVHKGNHKGQQCMMYAHRYWMQRNKEIHLWQEAETMFFSSKATTRPKQKVFELFVTDLQLPKELEGE